MTLAADRRAARAELDFLVDTLQPPARLGDYALTGHLARSETAALYTARGPLFGAAREGVLKLTGSGYAPILQRELGVLCAAAAADVPGVVRPLSSELLWCAAGATRLDRPVAAMVLPFLSGGDVAAVVARAARTGALGSRLALQVARPVAEALRGLLADLAEPMVHGDLRPQHVLLPSPDAPLSELTLVDLDAAMSPYGARVDPTDVRSYGELLCLAATGDPHLTRDLGRRLGALVRNCLNDSYASMADPRLWRDLSAAEDQATGRSGSNPMLKLSQLVPRLRRS